ncbi:MAG: PAS domain S-box protein [Flavobacteriales bacterium]|nr:PAS domain S-box protein [Flavobacteriales bacterium]
MDPEKDIYEVLFENAGQGMIVCNKSGSMEIVNPSLCNMFGYTKEELVGQQVEMLIPTNLRKAHHQHREDYNQAPVERRMGGSMDLLGQRKDGTVFSVEVGLNHCMIKDEFKVVAIVTDITERVQAQNRMKELNQELEDKVMQRTHELEKSQKLYNLIARNFPRGIINVFDQDMNYVFAEGQELDKVGLSSENLIGKNFKIRYNKELQDEMQDRLSIVFKGAGISFEYKDDHDFYVVNAVPLRSGTGEIEQILVIEKNITDSKLAEQEMQKNLNKERELNELKSRFVSMASHEFRTPLSTILSSATLAEKYPETEQQENRVKHLNRIKSSVKNLTSILNDFLSIDKLEDGKVEIKPSVFKLNELLREAMEEMEPYLKTEQVIRFDSAMGDQEEVESDRNVIKNSIINLLSNASKYSDAGKEIGIQLEKDNQSVQISITDQGIGIPKSEQDKLFTSRFFRAGNVTNIEGTGLGLTIVKKYLSLLNGNINFVSEENKGTTFTIEIPNILL